MRLNIRLLAAIVAILASSLYAEDEAEVRHQEHADQLNLQQLEPQSAFQPPQTITRYVCPMHPNIVRHEPGNCPICGMDLEPMEISASSEISVSVGGKLQQALGLRVEHASYRTLWRYLETVGTITYDDRLLSHIHPRAAGWIERLHVQSEGQQVSKGELLYEIYSPELVVAQDEFRSTLNAAKSFPSARRKALIDAARTRLRLLGLSASVIAQVEQQNKTLHTVPYYAEKSGVVSRLLIRQGMYVMPQDEIVTLVELNQVWLIADLFEAQQRWFKPGQPVELDLDSVGIKAREAVIDYIYPELDPITRSMKLRIELDNRDGALIPGQIADLRLYGGPKRGVLAIPAEALIVTGSSNRVVVQIAQERFEQREVTVGLQAQGYVEILEGLKVGDSVVTSGQFLLDSEANLKASLQRAEGVAHPHAHH